MTVTMSMTSMPALPSKVVDEIMTRLGERQRISSDEIVAILKKYEVAGDAEALQDSYRKRLGQRFMAAIRGEAGRREISKQCKWAGQLCPKSGRQTAISG